MNESKEILSHMLGILRAASILHQSSHWQVKGPMFYGDHEMLKRIYDSLGDEIDTLGEKIVQLFGSISVDPCQQGEIILEHIQEIEKQSMGDPLARALLVEKDLQETFEKAYDHLKESGKISLGLDDFIMSVANNHETNIYLLQQRLQK